MATIAEEFQTAFAHHQAGQLREAEVLYRRILAADPNHADALHLLGLVAYQAGRHDSAVELIRGALALCADRAVFHANLGEALRVLGRLDEAEQSLTTALRLDDSQPDAHNSLGNVHRALGRDAEAVASFWRAIDLRPNFAEAHNNLGTVLQGRGHVAGALVQYRRALELNPLYADAHHNLGTAHHAQGELDLAAASFLEAHRLAPRSSEALLNLGNVRQEQGRHEEAIGCYRESLVRNPRSAVALNNLGSVHSDLKQFDEAIRYFREAIALDPDLVDAHFNLAAALHAQEDWDAAEAAYAETLRLKSDHAQAMVSLGNVRQHQGRVNEALALVDRAIELEPSLAKARLHRGNLYKFLRRHAEAVAEYQEALRLDPDFPEAYNNLAVLLTEIDQPDAALECCRQGLAQDPTAAALYANMATALQNLGRADEAIACARKSVELRPEGVGEHTNLLYKLLFHPEYDAQAIYEEHLRWAARHAEPLTALAAGHTNDRTSDRTLRIGYVSPYFREHAVNFFTEPMIAAHNHRGFEVYCYSDVATEDAVTARLRAAADHWRDVRLLSDADLAKVVRDDAIDILVDLTGHIAGNRLLTFARKPAPVQVTYIGYQNTTGMSAMDYRLTDAWADPPGVTDRYYTEKLVRLPRAFFCYRPSDGAPDVAPPPAMANGYVTFGSFNNFAKVTPSVIEAWLTILERVANSKLLVLARPGGFIQRNLESLAGKRGIDAARIEFCEKRPRANYLELFSRVDVALDPFPFNGHTTTCDAVWMGVPVVMLAGGSYASRFGGSVLRNVGLSDLIADSTDGYIELACRFAGDLRRLAQLRRDLRPRMAASPLLDAAGFTRNLEAAYRQMWDAWCGS